MNSIEISPIPPEVIIEHVAKEFGVTIKDITSDSQKWKFAIPRKICWLFMREINGYSHRHIGVLFNRVSSTVTIGLKSINNELDVDKRLWQKCSKLVTFFVNYNQNGL